MLRKTATRDNSWGPLGDIVTVSVRVDITYPVDASPNGKLTIFITHVKGGRGTDMWTETFTRFPVTKSSPALVRFLHLIGLNLGMRNKPGELKKILSYIERCVIDVQDQIPSQASGKKAVKKKT